MQQPDVLTAPGKHRGITPASGLVVLVGAIGVLMAHHPMILTGLARVQVGLDDTRFNNYVLEHDYRWLRGDSNHAGFWDPPFFYPARNAAAYSDLLISVAPVYMAFRAVGLAPDTAYQVWMMVMSALNYAIASRILGRRFGMTQPGAAAAAFLFAFGAPRINQLNHPQLVPQFLSLVTLDALFGIFSGEAKRASAGKRGFLWLAAWLGVVGQLYCGFYLGWFLILTLAIAAALALGGRPTRGPLLAILRRDAACIVLTGGIAGLLLCPLLVHYLAAAREFGPRHYPTVKQFVPHWRALFYVGPDSWLWGWWVRPRLAAAYVREDEKRLGVGLLTSVVSAWGLYRNRGRTAIGLLLGVAIGLLICVLQLPQPLVQWLCLLAILLALVRDSPAVCAPVATRVWALGGLLGYLYWGTIHSEELVGVGLGALALVVADLARGRPPSVQTTALAAVGLGLAFWLFAPAVLGHGLLIGALAACGAAVLRVRPLGRAGVAGVAVMVLFAALTSYSHRPMVLAVGALAPLLVAVARPAGNLLAPRWRIGMLVLALAVMTVYRDDDTAWSTLRTHVPGAAALYAVARAGLMILVVWAIGLGLFVDGLCLRGRPVAALVVCLVCLLEQGLTTPSFDKQANRATIAALAGRVDCRDAAFFYSPHQAHQTPYRYHIDAMWAALESGVPTVNGYSGNFPILWHPLTDPNIVEECDEICLEGGLRRWLGAYGLAPGRIGWIGGPADWRGESGPAPEAGMIAAPAIPVARSGPLRYPGTNTKGSDSRGDGVAR